jgi:hypothetical protein
MDGIFRDLFSAQSSCKTFLKKGIAVPYVLWLFPGTSGTLPHISGIFFLYNFLAGYSGKQVQCAGSAGCQQIVWHAEETGDNFLSPGPGTYDTDRLRGIPDSMIFFSWILTGLAVFLVADAVLAIRYGKPYMMWGLDCTPAIYRDFITGVSSLPRGIVLAIKLAECAAGLVLFWFALKIP